MSLFDKHLRSKPAITPNTILTVLHLPALRKHLTTLAYLELCQMISQTGPDPLPPHYDPLGEYEMNTTPYKLTAFIPPRLPLKQSLLNFVRTPGAKHTQNNSGYSPLKELSHLSQKTIVLKSAYFPLEMRCEHVQGANRLKQAVTACKEGCYLLEKGGNGANWKCADKDCEGHVYCGDILKDEKGRCCFGKKGERMVCLKQRDDN